ncbi:Aldehyde/histidinol dehydrogenase [Mycena sanguinolenta]|nr:Aldehyde/histidinol dehydrogenase [Mycena sanguinolenta]
MSTKFPGACKNTASACSTIHVAFARGNVSPAASRRVIVQMELLNSRRFSQISCLQTGKAAANTSIGLDTTANAIAAFVADLTCRTPSTNAVTSTRLGKRNEEENRAASGSQSKLLNLEYIQDKPRDCECGCSESKGKRKAATLKRGACDLFRVVHALIPHTHAPSQRWPARAGSKTKGSRSGVGQTRRRVNPAEVSVQEEEETKKKEKKCRKRKESRKQQKKRRQQAVRPIEAPCRELGGIKSSWSFGIRTSLLPKASTSSPLRIVGARVAGVEPEQGGYYRCSEDAAPEDIRRARRTPYERRRGIGAWWDLGPDTGEGGRVSAPKGDARVGYISDLERMSMSMPENGEGRQANTKQGTSPLRGKRTAGVGNSAFAETFCATPARRYRRRIRAIFRDSGGAQEAPFKASFDSKTGPRLTAECSFKSSGKHQGCEERSIELQAVNRSWAASSADDDAAIATACAAFPAWSKTKPAQRRNMIILLKVADLFEETTIAGSVPHGVVFATAPWQHLPAEGPRAQPAPLFKLPHQSHPPGALNVLYTPREDSPVITTQLVNVPHHNAAAGCALNVGGKAAAMQCTIGAFARAGQIYMSTERVVVHEVVVDRFRPALQKAVAGFPPPRARPVDALTKGATLLHGNHTAEDETRESSATRLRPIVVEGVSSEMALHHDEGFGPTVSVVVVKDEDQVVTIANGSEYGLSSAVFPRYWHGGRVANSRLEGCVYQEHTHINAMSVHDEPNLLHEGVKSSGWGRFNGQWDLEVFFAHQDGHVNVNRRRTKLRERNMTVDAITAKTSLQFDPEAGALNSGSVELHRPREDKEERSRM